ncbi:hypothetical protein [Mycoplasma suis]|uniref:Uncharacterized protein n=2 Tax=Mycoplasma suis TaxID=57372 RepID=F0QQ93_MYCSL|nr:hypothetical protein [Mycoplasma suis]ADX97663.1 hypothetical protein MSU_0119 [Mycoplasma suis str. Illinois]CBZ40200.1 hypothetical protein MSUIS_01070 [Mycoplasma suis KI3806]
MTSPKVENSQENQEQSSKTRTIRSTETRKNISPDSIIAEYAYVEKENRGTSLSCERLKAKMEGEGMWFYESWCRNLFKSMWTGQEAEAPQRLFKIQEDKVFNTLAYYVGVNGRSDDESFKSDLESGLKLGNLTCKSQGKKDGKVVVFCDPQNTFFDSLVRAQ